MPQMAPISWTILFLTFSVTFVIFNMINYYNKNFFNTNSKEMNKMNKKFPKMFINWKW